MTPADIPNVENMLQLWLLAMVRPGAAFLAAPAFGANSVPVQLRLIIAVALGLPAINASAVAIPADGLVSWSGFVLIAGEVVIGLAIGFVLQLAVAATLIAGETISNAMGLGFAAMVDPLSEQMSSVVGQFFGMLATALFLAADGHLELMRIITGSYIAFPAGNAFPSHNTIGGIIDFSGLMFSAAVTIALPVGFALILIQIIAGVIGRSAPSLNLFAVGLPASLLFGIILMAVAVPSMADVILETIAESLMASAAVAGL